jgi:hypothetical protein
MHEKMTHVNLMTLRASEAGNGQISLCANEHQKWDQLKR